MIGSPKRKHGTRGEQNTPRARVGKHCSPVSCRPVSPAVISFALALCTSPFSRRRRRRRIGTVSPTTRRRPPSSCSCRPRSAAIRPQTHRRPPVRSAGTSASIAAWSSALPTRARVTVVVVTVTVVIVVSVVSVVVVVVVVVWRQGTSSPFHAARLGGQVRDLKRPRGGGRRRGCGRRGFGRVALQRLAT